MIFNYYVIHCDKHTERLDHIENHLKKNIPELKVWQGTLIEKIEENLNIQFKNYSQDISYTENNVFQNPGEIGCYLSHHLLLKHLIKHDNEDGYTIILEDDVTLCNDFENKLENILLNNNKDFDILFLSLSACNRRFTQEMKNNKITEFNSVVKSKTSGGQGTYGMVYCNKHLKKIYDITCNAIHAIDVVYVMKIKEHALSSYVCTPYLCIHTGELSSTIHDKDCFVKQQLFASHKSLFS